MIRRRLRAAVAALPVLAMSATGVSAHAQTPSGTTAFGTLMTAPWRAELEYQQGMRTAMMELDWNAYEPSKGAFSADYIAYKRGELAALRRAGFTVSLGLGIHHTPAWVFAIPGSRMVDQYGNRSGELNLVFNQAVRDQVAKYLVRVDRDLGLEHFWGLRISSGGSAELMYPGAGSYWAFDTAAQTGRGLAKSLRAAPLPGWRPGTSQRASNVTAWQQWYHGALVDVAKWQMAQARSLGFTGYYQLLTPGVGVHPAKLQKAINANLPDGLVGIGATWPQVYAAFKGRTDLAVHVTSVADGSGADDSCTVADRGIPLTAPVTATWSATRWQTRLAGEYGFAVTGENPGFGESASLNAKYVDLSSAGMLSGATRQAVSCGLLAFYWAHDAQLFDGTVPFASVTQSVRSVNARTTSLSWPTTPSSALVTPVTGSATAVPWAQLPKGAIRLPG